MFYFLVLRILLFRIIKSVNLSVNVVRIKICFRERERGMSWSHAEHADLEGVGRRPRPYPLFLNLYSKITQNMWVYLNPSQTHTHTHTQQTQKISLEHTSPGKINIGQTLQWIKLEYLKSLSHIFNSKNLQFKKNS